MQRDDIMEIRLENVNKTFKNGKRVVEALKNINIKINDGEFFGVLGPSGAGKTTLMRVIAGLETPTTGSVYFDNNVVARDNKNIVDVEDRNIGMVFQTWGLYPHLSVYDNIAFPLRVKRWSEDEIKKRIYEITDILNIRNTINLKPGQISGGQQQRVALCRALVKNPTILILDEPFSNLDAVIKDSARELAREIHNRDTITTLIVSHDPADIFSLADRAAVINHGVMEQLAEPLEIYDNPKSLDISKLIGDINTFEVEIENDNDTPFFDLNGTKIEAPGYPAGRAIIGIRPEDIKILDNDDKGYKNIGEATVRVSSYASGQFKITLSFVNSDIQFSINSEIPYKTGKNVPIGIRENKIKFFDINTGAALKLMAEQNEA
ncbi:carbohydrate ABC transporter ATP-binding protein, CUT1 family [Picrophilus oshimae DSM 9789]|uniref:Alpha glucoside ABC transporter ATP-binding protein n=2 Tax=Picrophilus oshimae TaxID=46632 RepID=Q6KZ73_PICTO|nr:alpha glucoside ABC transporter ATP-binding protein [Picrophilus oshimae DSM 9789]SMD30950.1 carbohydrate ABC transporter ATP-binding protein, CUT1 family [Picrophilus oshimae DSM 9789]